MTKHRRSSDYSRRDKPNNTCGCRLKICPTQEEILLKLLKTIPCTKHNNHVKSSSSCCSWEASDCETSKACCVYDEKRPRAKNHPRRFMNRPCSYCARNCPYFRKSCLPEDYCSLCDSYLGCGSCNDCYTYRKCGGCSTYNLCGPGACGCRRHTCWPDCDCLCSCPNNSKNYCKDSHCLHHCKNHPCKKHDGKEPSCSADCHIGDDDNDEISLSSSESSDSDDKGCPKSKKSRGDSGCTKCHSEEGSRNSSSCTPTTRTCGGGSECTGTQKKHSSNHHKRCNAQAKTTGSIDSKRCTNNTHTQTWYVKQSSVNEEYADTAIQPREREFQFSPPALPPVVTAAPVFGDATSDRRGTYLSMDSPCGSSTKKYYPSVKGKVSCAPVSSDCCCGSAGYNDCACCEDCSCLEDGAINSKRLLAILVFILLVAAGIGVNQLVTRCRCTYFSLGSCRCM